MMRRLLSLLAFLLSLSLLPTAAEAQEQSPANNRKVIQDPAEYNAYIKALNTQDPMQKAPAMEEFIAEYPNSVVLEDALEQALAAYQQAGNQVAMEKTARKLLQVDANNVRALAFIVYSTRARLTQGDKGTAVETLHVLADQGLRAVRQWEKPEGMSQNDFETRRRMTKIVFYGAAGFAALQRKDYPTARDHYTRAVVLDPNDLQNVYQLGIADLEMQDLDVRGFWYVAHAIHIVERQNSVPAAQLMTRYGQSKYQKYHGSLEGWDRIRGLAAQATLPPTDFNVARATLTAEASSLTGTSVPAASLTSNSSPGQAHNVSASALSSSATPAGIGSPTAQGLTSGRSGHGASASILSYNSPGSGHAVPASVLSSGSSGKARGVSASIASSDPRLVAKSLVRFGRPHEPLEPVPIFLSAHR